MAKNKDKDKGKKQEEEFVDENQGDINESDDTFGLPDVDYKPLEEEAAEAEEELSEEIEETTNEIVEEVEETVAETEEAAEETSYSDDQSEYYEEESVEEPGEEIVDGGDSGSEDPPKRFTYEEKSSPAGKIILAVLAVIIVIAAVWYFGFKRPAQIAAEKAKQEQLEKQREEQAEKERLAEQERQRRLAEERAAQEEVAEQNNTPEPGTIGTITEATNRYYVVVGSFIDEDLAMDYAKKLATNGVGSNILSPTSTMKFYRLALSDHDTYAEAQTVADGLKGEYSENTWVLKY